MLHGWGFCGVASPKNFGELWPTFWGAQPLLPLYPTEARQYTARFSSFTNYASVLYRFLDIASYLSKVAIFPTPYMVHQLAVTLEFQLDFDNRKTDSVSCLFSVLVGLRLVTDRQADGQTHGRQLGKKAQITFADSKKN